MKEVIQLAVDSHLAWTATFRDAIDRKFISGVVANCQYDDKCSIGKWLYSLDDEIKRRPECRRVKDLHYRFHVEAGEILRLMKAARYDEARAHLAGDYASASAQLLAALREWQAVEDSR